MTETKIYKLTNVCSERYKDRDVCLVAAAGFEERNIALLDIFQKKSVKLSKFLLIDYGKEIDEEMKDELIKTAKLLSKELQVVMLAELRESTAHEFRKLLGIVDAITIIDITGMNRSTMFYVLSLIDELEIEYDVVYTEAEEYYPLKDFYEKINEKNNREWAFTNYLELEKTEFAYSYDCEIYTPDRFRGQQEPGKPYMLLSFFAFKRSRLQLILQEMEFEKKLFILSEPVRDDLKWRRDFMEIANWDLIEKNRPYVKVLDTLTPFAVLEILENGVKDNGNIYRYNLVLVPLGSKMQTFGSYLFWRRHRETAVMFTNPQTYFKDAYSKGYRDTFLIASEQFHGI